jgi:hypothetical protein
MTVAPLSTSFVKSLNLVVNSRVSSSSSFGTLSKLAAISP